jgi:hypothetical protein
MVVVNPSHTQKRKKKERRKHSITLYAFKVAQKAPQDEKRYNMRGTKMDGIGFNNGP